MDLATDVSSGPDSAAETSPLEPTSMVVDISGMGFGLLFIYGIFVAMVKYN
jgi:hypothetical protein